jgi:hypothetical protein
VKTSRRDLLSALSSISALSAICSSRLSADAIGQVLSKPGDSGEQTSEKVQAAYDFWSEDIRNPDYGRTRSIGPNVAPRAVCIYYDKSKGFVTGSDIGDIGLPDRGDVNVLVNVDHIRPSTNDQSRFANLDGGSLRIDLQQSTPMPSLTERLAWTAIAAFLPENKKLPPLKDMTFDPGTTWGKLTSVAFPGGGGTWTWNFFLQHRKSRWMQLFDTIRSSHGLLLPIMGLGLPAIAVTALLTVDKIVAGLTKDANTDWLFQSADNFIYATKEARDSFEGSKMRLKQGMYIVIPSTHLASFSKQQAGLVIKDGLIVPANTSSLNVMDAAQQTIPDVTYITVGVTAKVRAPLK